MEKVVAVVSGKGGVGKTTFSSNVGLALKKLGEDVTVLDGDMSNSNLGLQLGFFQFPLGLQDAMRGNISIHKAAYTHPSGLSVVPSSVSMKYIKKNPNHRRLKRLVNDLRGVVLIDSPPGVGKDVENVIRAADEVVVVTNPEIPAVTDALKVIQVSKELGTEPVGIVINKATGKNELRADEVEALAGIRVLGSVPHDKTVKKSIFNRNPVVHDSPNSRASQAFFEIASGICGREYSKPRMLRMKRLLRR
jgi:septum site-determining protein MinD